MLRINKIAKKLKYYSWPRTLPFGQGSQPYYRIFASQGGRVALPFSAYEQIMDVP